MNDLKVDFNKIYIFESLDPEDYKTGKGLCENLRLREILYNGKFSVEFHIINSSQELKDKLNDVFLEVQDNSVKPFIHFEMHGDKQKRGLLCSGELVSWSELKELVVNINSILRNELYLSFSSCFGAWFFSTMVPTDRSPCKGFVGVWNELYLDQMLKFTGFFDELFKSGDINSATDVLNNENESIPNSVEFGYYDSDKIFDKIWDRYEADFIDNDINFNKRVEKLTEKAMEDRSPYDRRSRDQMKKEIERMILTRRDTTREQKKAKFLHQS